MIETHIAFKKLKLVYYWSMLCKIYFPCKNVKCYSSRYCVFKLSQFHVFLLNSKMIDNFIVRSVNLDMQHSVFVLNNELKCIARYNSLASIEINKIQ